MKRYFLLILFLQLSLFVFAQLDAGEDIIICKGDETQLNASGGSNYLWTSIPNDPTLSDPNIPNPTVQPDTTTMYIVMAREVGNNTIGNSDFEQGNSGFTSEYIYNPVSIWDEGTYAIVTDANTVHPNFSCDEDHSTGEGMMMCVNGAGVQNVEVWSKTIPFVIPNTEFEFSTWITSLSPENPAILQFSINGELLGQPFEVNSNTCEWNQFFEIWNSGTSTSADISIVNQNTATSGNDFALDDISFAVAYYYYDTVVVHVLDAPTSDFTIDNEFCSMDTATIDYSGNAPDTSVFHWDFDGGIVLTGQDAGPFKVQWDVPGAKNISLWVKHACVSDTTVQTIIVYQSPDAIVIADNTSIPYGTNTTLHGSMSGDPGPLNFIWDPDTELVDPSVLDPVTQLLYATTEFVFTVTDESSQCKSSDTVQIEVDGSALSITSIIAQPDTICYGEYAEIQLFVSGGSGDYTASWTSDPPGFVHEGPEMIITVGPNNTTTYFVTVNDGFTTTPMDSVQVVVLPQISISSQPSDTTVAPEQDISFKVEATNVLAYQWQVSKDGGANWINLTDNSSISGSNSSTLSINPTTTDMNAWLFRCLLNGRCDPQISDPALLEIVEAPTMVNYLQGADVCELDSVPVPYYVSNFINIIELQLVLEYDAEHLTFIGIQNIAPELQVEIEVTDDGNKIIIHWVSSNPVSITTENIFDFKFLASSSGTSSLQWEQDLSYATNSLNYNTTMVFSGAEIIVNALPVTPDYIYSNYDTLSILDEVEIILTAEGGSGDKVLWTKEECNGTYIGEGNPYHIFRPEATTTYYARWETVCGLSECSEVLIVINQEFEVFAPNAFTPNGDGVNDEFKLVSGNDLYSFRMIIFDRWGKQVFESNDLYSGWDGTINGSPAMYATYVWKATYQFRREGSGKESEVQSGIVNLIR